MKCLHCCSEDLKVLETRQTDEGPTRRRLCLNCDHRWSTIEIDLDWYKRVQADNLALKQIFSKRRIQQLLSHINDALSTTPLKRRPKK